MLLPELLEQAGVAPSSLEPFPKSEEGCLLAAVSGAAALPAWDQLRRRVEETGYWPVLIGERESLTFLQEGLEIGQAPTAAGIIQRGAALDVDEWFAVRLAEMEEEEERDPATGPWPEDVKPHRGFVIHLDIRSRQPLHQVYLALAPAQDCWHVPAYLRYGGWNECPAPWEHVGVMRRWHERYGAELVAMSLDTVEMHVPQPPQDRGAALALAREQYLYCEDIVCQGTETVEALAASLLRGTSWFFWWD